MSIESTPAPLRTQPYRARRATFAFFFVAGFVNLWLVYLPQFKHTLRLSDGELGVVLLALPAGALLAMQAAGRLSQRFGSRAPTVASAVLLGCVVVGPALAWSLASLWVAVFAIGLANGALDVAMNVQAVAVERQYGRSVMNAFHAVFSLGAAAGALLGGAALAAVLPTAAVLGVHGLLLAATALACAPALLNRAAEHPEPAASAAAAPDRSSRAPAAAWLLGLVGFCCLLGEGAAGDWSAVHLREALGADAATAALGYAAFSTTMTIGRLVGDRVVTAVGAVPVVRYGGLLAAAGLALVVLAPQPWLAVTGWAVAGIGLATVIPQVFVAAGSLPAGALALTRVTTLSYLGLLAGPPIIGLVAEVTGLAWALLLPCLLALVVSAGAPLVRRTG